MSESKELHKTAEVLLLSPRPASESVLAGLFGALPMPATLVDAAGTILDVNPAFLAHASLVRGRVVTAVDRIGHHLLEFADTDTERAQVTALLRTVVDDGRPGSYTSTYHLNDGHLTSRSVSGIPLRDHNGRVVAAVLLREDVSAAARRERQHQLEGETADRILAQAQLLQTEATLRQSLEREQAMGRIRDWILSLTDVASFSASLEGEWLAELRGLGIPVYRVSVQSPQKEPGEYAVQWTLLSRENGATASDARRFSFPWVREAWDTGRPVVVSRQRLEECGFGDPEVKAIVELPLPGGGSLGVSSREEEGFDEAGVAALQTFAGLLAVALQRLRHLQALEQSARALERAQQVAHVGSWTWHVQTNRLEWSAEMYRIFGIDPTRFSGDLAEVVARAVHPDDRAAVERANQTVAQHGKPEPLQYRVVHPDGSVRVVWGEAGELSLDDAGRPVRLTGIVQDITERQEAESHLRLELALQQLRGRVLEMHGEEDWQRLVVAAHELLGEFVPHYACSINLLDRVRGTLVVHYVDAHDAAVHTNPERRLAPDLLAAFIDAIDHDRPLYRASRRDPLFAPSMPAVVHSVVDLPFAAGTVAVSATTENAFSPHRLEILRRFVQVLSEGYQRLVDLRATEDLRQQLAQSQKMQAVGQLASGLAHDLNNHLTVISGYGQLLQRGAAGPQREAAMEIRRACDQGAALIRQLLAFGRRQVLHPQPLSLNVLLEDLQRMLGRLLGERIALTLELDPDLGTAIADEGQLQQVVLNLATNARDAMPDGGRLHLQTANQQVIHSRPIEGGQLPPGGYICLSVRDTGIGMDEATRRRIFEPFFTTKERGQGTGLGLATAWGIVTQSGGHLEVETAPDQGTSFTIWLPRIQGAVAGLQATTPVQSPTWPRGQTVLVVEDDQALRKLLRRLLEQSGFQVLEAENGIAAVELARRHPQPIALLLTDVVMPAMDGRTLAETLPGLHPETRLLYMSGYPDGVIDRYGVLEPGTTLLSKPFSSDQLLAAVSAVLGGSATTPEAE